MTPTNDALRAAQKVIQSAARIVSVPSDNWRPKDLLTYIDKCNATLTTIDAALAVEAATPQHATLEYLLRENGDGYHPTIRDLCFTAFMNAFQKNLEDGGKTDWFTDTKPIIDKAIERIKRDIECPQGPAQTEPNAEGQGEVVAAVEPPPSPTWVKALESANDGITGGIVYFQTERDEHYRWVVTDDDVVTACLADRFEDVPEVSAPIAAHLTDASPGGDLLEMLRKQLAAAQVPIMSGPDTCVGVQQLPRALVNRVAELLVEPVTSWSDARRDAAVGQQRQTGTVAIDELMIATRQRRDAQAAQIARLMKALEPFASFGKTEDGGDIRDGLMRDRICDWFGPSDFDAARAALSTPEASPAPIAPPPPSWLPHATFAAMSDELRRALTGSGTEIADWQANAGVLAVLGVLPLPDGGKS